MDKTDQKFRKQETIRRRLRPLAFLPAICMMCVIFLFSAENGDDSTATSTYITVLIVQGFNDLMDYDWTSSMISLYAAVAEGFIRKVAHVTEYTLLSMSVALPLALVYRIRGRRLFLSAFLFCVLFAALDEFHQVFVPGRVAAVKDVFIDMIGILLGIGLSCLIHRPKKRRQPSNQGQAPEE